MRQPSGSSLLGADSDNPASANARRSRLLFSLATAFLFAFAAALAQAKDYTRIVVFGDSLSDTGNVANLTEAKYGFRVPAPSPTTLTADSPTASIPSPPPRNTSAYGWSSSLLPCPPGPR